MRLAFMGTPDFSVAALDALVKAGHNIAAVYCQPPRAAGRGKKLRASPVHQRAEQLGLLVRHPTSLKTDAEQAEFAALQVDAAVVVAYGLILPQAILDAPKMGCINIHASLLPRWRGAAPIHRAIMAGDRETGVCIMQMDAGLDTGPVLARHAIDISADETTPSLHDTLAILGADMVVETLAHMAAGTASATPQPADGISYAHKIDKAEAAVDWAASAEEINAHIRALQPFPGAYSMLGDLRLKLLASEIVAQDHQAAPGSLIDAQAGIVACGSGALRLITVQKAGKAPMDWATFNNGFQAKEGAMFTSEPSA